MKSKYQSVAVRRDTFERLRAYKMGGATFDDVLNDLMDAQPLEEFAAEVIKEAKKRLRTFKGRDWKEVRKSLGDD